MLYPQQDQSSPSVSPSSAKALLNNSIGGNSWRLVGQWIEWDFDVPEDGYYDITLYDKQNFSRGIHVSRRITIDGEVHTVSKGDTLLKQDGVMHGCTCLEDGILIDIFTPMREDFL